MTPPSSSLLYNRAIKRRLPQCLSALTAQSTSREKLGCYLITGAGRRLLEAGPTGSTSHGNKASCDSAGSSEPRSFSDLLGIRQGCAGP